MNGCEIFLLSGRFPAYKFATSYTYHYLLALFYKAYYNEITSGTLFYIVGQKVTH